MYNYCKFNVISLYSVLHYVLELHLYYSCNFTL